MSLGWGIGNNGRKGARWGEGDHDGAACLFERRFDGWHYGPVSATEECCFVAHRVYLLDWIAIDKCRTTWNSLTDSNIWFQWVGTQTSACMQTRQSILVNQSTVALHNKGQIVHGLLCKTCMQSVLHSIWDTVYAIVSNIQVSVGEVVTNGTTGWC